MNSVVVLFRLLKLVKPLKCFMLLAVFTGTLGFLAAQFIPILASIAISNIINNQAIKEIIIIIPILAILRAIFRLIEQRTNHYIAFTLLAIIRDKVFVAMRKLCPAKLENKDKGNLISLITSDVELLEVFYAHTISPICIALLTEIIMCIYIGRIHILLGLFAAISFLIVGVVLPIIIYRLSGNKADLLRKENGEIASYVLENIKTIDDTLQFDYGLKRLEGMDKKIEDISKLQNDHNRLTSNNLGIANFTILIFDILMLLLSIYLYQMKQIDISGMLIAVVSLMSSFGPVNALASLGTGLQSTIASGRRVLSIIDEKPELLDISGKQKTIYDGFNVDNVSFGYGDETVLNEVSLKQDKNEIVGIVGKSGCGKSTLLKLLMRFWKVRNGEIKISNRNIEDINSDDLKDMESYMRQDTQLFKDSIANNIKVAKLDASDEEVIDACKKASLHDFIMSLPDGYDTELAEMGNSLSHGEKQRISLARAFLHDGDLMLLDEPTSNLDSLNEAIILRSLKQQAKDKTVILVSHRKSTVRVADRIVQMKDGKIFE